MGPAVSVLLPVRDARPTLAECLASLAAQTLDDHEVVAVNDGSRDGSDEILDAQARHEPRLRVLHRPARGLVATLNEALAAARGTFVARMDADDVADRERLSLQAERLHEDPAVDVLGCRVRLLGARRGMRAYVAWQNRLLDHDAIVRDLYVEAPLVHPSVMMRAETLRRLGGYRAFDGPEDYDLWLRAHAAGLRFGKRSEVLLTWRDRGDRLTRRDPRYAPERFQALKLDALCAGLLADRDAVVIWGAGPIGKSWCRALRARGLGVQAFVEVDPRKIGRRIHGAPVVAVAEAGAFRGPLHLAAVGQAGARARIRAEARRLGLVETRDFVAVA
jgi:glycosyltransferase involved in cell wall biosynthesis